jgi:predicted adenylyl cyclase CyaB
MASAKREIEARRTTAFGVGRIAFQAGHLTPFVDACFMPANIEIKARTNDFATTRKLAEDLTDTPCQLLEQEDSFFNVPRGRLKLRIINSSNAELIFYERPDGTGPRQSNYSIVEISDPHSLKVVLGASLGIRGIVKQRRWLYLAGQTRIHLDEVEGLGSFVELEFVMRSGQTPEEGTQEVNRVLQKLQIKEADLLSCAYVDMLTCLECS